MFTIVEDLRRQCELRLGDWGSVGKAKYGDSHHHTLSSINDLAVVLAHSGQLQEAEAFFQESVQKSRGLMFSGDSSCPTISFLTLGAQVSID